MPKVLEKLLKKEAQRKARRAGIARLRAGNGVILEFDILPPRDSIIRYSDGFTFVIIRREGYMIRAHITCTSFQNGTLIYEGDIIRFVRLFGKSKKIRRVKRDAFTKA